MEAEGIELSAWANKNAGFTLAPSEGGAERYAAVPGDTGQRSNVAPFSPGAPEVAAYREKVPPADGCRACAKSFGRTQQACLYHAIGYAVAEVAHLSTRLALLDPCPVVSGSEGGGQ